MGGWKLIMSGFWLIVCLSLTVMVYILRGFGLLSFLPGGVILGLAGMSGLCAIAYAIDKNRRF